VAGWRALFLFHGGLLIQGEVQQPFDSGGARRKPLFVSEIVYPFQEIRVDHEVQ
jgi:hypothetical protein